MRFVLPGGHSRIGRKGQVLFAPAKQKVHFRAQEYPSRNVPKELTLVATLELVSKGSQREAIDVERYLDLFRQNLASQFRAAAWVGSTTGDDSEKWRLATHFNREVQSPTLVKGL